MECGTPWPEGIRKLDEPCDAGDWGQSPYCDPLRDDVHHVRAGSERSSRVPVGVPLRAPWTTPEQGLGAGEQLERGRGVTPGLGQVREPGQADGDVAAVGGVVGVGGGEVLGKGLGAGEQLERGRGVTAGLGQVREPGQPIGVSCTPAATASARIISSNPAPARPTRSATSYNRTRPATTAETSL